MFLRVPVNEGWKVRLTPASLHCEQFLQYNTPKVKNNILIPFNKYLFIYLLFAYLNVPVLSC